MYLTFNELEQAFREDLVPDFITPAPSGSPHVVFADFQGDSNLSFHRDDVLTAGDPCEGRARFGDVAGPEFNIRSLRDDVRLAFASIDRVRAEVVQLPALACH